MKIYEASTAPNPRRVRIFLAEKGIDMNYVQVDIEAGENIRGELREKNLTTKVPFLELDDGTVLGETVAICRYFEELYPERPLMGTTALEKAQIEMWQRRVEFHLMMNVGLCFQHTTGYFKDRMTPVADFGKEAGKLALEFMATLDEHLANSTYIAGETFTIADITALCAIDFGRVMKLRIDESQIHLKRWHEQVSQRPSASA